MAENWAIIPFIGLVDMTLDAVGDLLNQTYPMRVLLVSNGSTSEERAAMESRIAGTHPQVLLWHHDPPLPSLGATWNRALEFVWETGAERALVPNNDVRLHPRTFELLNDAMEQHQALFVSAVNTGEMPDPYVFDLTAKGGPDFSCFMISKEAHAKYPFDANLTYCNDVDLHRRFMLGGDGAKIFSVNVPYKHLASQTIKRADPEKAQRYQETAGQHRAYYARKWGGPVNDETFNAPWKASETQLLMTGQIPPHLLSETERATAVPSVCSRTPDLQADGCAGLPHLWEKWGAPARGTEEDVK